MAHCSRPRTPVHLSNRM